MHRNVPPTAARFLPRLPWWKRRRWRLVIAAALVAITTVPLTWLHRQRSAAEQDALDFVGLHGSYSWTYAPGEFHQFLKIYFGDRVARFLCFRRISVCMVPEKFTDNMIDYLLAIHDLDSVCLYDRHDPAVKPGVRMVAAPIQEVATSASSEGIAKFQRRFPRVEVIVLPDAHKSAPRGRNPKPSC